MPKSRWSFNEDITVTMTWQLWKTHLTFWMPTCQSVRSLCRRKRQKSWSLAKTRSQWGSSWSENLGNCRRQCKVYRGSGEGWDEEEAFGVFVIRSTNLKKFWEMPRHGVQAPHASTRSKDVALVGPTTIRMRQNSFPRSTGCVVQIIV